MREPHSFQCMKRGSTLLFCELSKFRKNHKPRPELTADTLRSFTDDGETKSGVIIDGPRIWSVFEPILSIYDLRESSDVPRAQCPS